MNRRSFLISSAAAVGAVPLRVLAAAQGARPPVKRDRLRLSITWGMFRDRALPEAFALMAKNDFDAFEMFNWRSPELLDAVAAEMKKHKLECACLIANKGVKAPGCSLTNPKERDAFLGEIGLSIKAAKKVSSKRLVVLTGDDVPGMSRAAMMDSCVAGLKEAAPLLERGGITAVVEVLNTHVDHAGYFLHFVRDGAEMIDRVGSPSVKLLFDIYHVQIMEGNLIRLIRDNIQRIAHFHIGDNPGRNQPGTGEINYRNVYRAILDTGYDGFAALEYRPTVLLEEDMPAQRRLSILV